MKYKNCISHFTLFTPKSSSLIMWLMFLYVICSNFSCNQNQEIDDLVRQENELRNELNKTKDETNNFKTGTEKAEEETKQAKERIKKAEEEMEKARKQADEAEKKAAEYRKQADTYRKQADDIKKKTDDLLAKLHRSPITQEKLDAIQTEANKAKEALSTKRKTLSDEEKQDLKQKHQAQQISIKNIQSVQDAINAMKKDGLQLRYLNPSLKKNKAVILEAVKQNGLAIFLADNTLQDNIELQNAAIAQSPRVQDILVKRNQCKQMEEIETTFTTYTKKCDSTYKKKIEELYSKLDKEHKKSLNASKTQFSSRLELCKALSSKYEKTEDIYQRNEDDMHKISQDIAEENKEIEDWKNLLKVKQNETKDVTAMKADTEELLECTKQTIIKKKLLLEISDESPQVTRLEEEILQLEEEINFLSADIDMKEAELNTSAIEVPAIEDFIKYLSNHVQDNQALLAMCSECKKILDPLRNVDAA